MLDLYKVLLRYKIESLVPTKLISVVIKSHFNNKLFEINGHRMILNQGLFNLSLGRPFEPLETQIIRSQVKEGNVVLDIGANIGYHTLTLAHMVGHNGKVFAFEPSPENFMLLQRNIDLNGYKNVVPEQLAVSDICGKTKLYLSSNPGDNRIHSPGEGAQFVEVGAIRLDDYFSNEKIDFVKMDIQGSEWLAINGMADILRKNSNIKILMEYSPPLLTASGAEPEAVLKLLTGQGFKLYNLNERLMKVVPVNVPELLREYNPKKKIYTNYTNLFASRNDLAYT